MAAIARMFVSLPTTLAGIEALKTIALFSGAGLLVSLLLGANGLEFSAGF